MSGSDIVPQLLEATATEGYRCYLLGDSDSNVSNAADFIVRTFPRWSIAGYSNGFFDSAEEEKVVTNIRESKPNLLLVGIQVGTPKQELFLTKYSETLNVPLCIGVGGLFRYWSGSLLRAPSFYRSLNLEWLWILAQQPYKWRRYTLDMVRFFAHVLMHIREPKYRQGVD